MGLSSQKQKTTSQSQEQTSGSTTPTNPEWVNNAVQAQNDRISAVGMANPYSFVAGINPALQSAANQVNGLGGWQDPLNTAMSLAQNAGRPVSATIYNPIFAGQAQTYSAPPLGAAGQASAQGYTASQATAAQIAANERANAASVLDNGGIQQYVSPHLGALVDSAIADYDESAGQSRAAAAAAAARNGAFGGSRYALGEAALEGELARGRASTTAQLNDNAYRFGAGLATTDANNRQQTSIFNAGQTNARNQAQAQLQQSTNLFNTDALNNAAAFGANANNQASMFNTGQSNNFALQQAAMDAQAAAANAAAQNQFSLFDAGTANNAAQWNAGAQNGMAQFNAGQGLQAASTLGNLANSQANNAQGDAALAMQLGMSLQEIDQMRAQAPLEFERLMAQLNASQPYSLFTGQNVTGSSNSSGSGTTTKSPSLLDGIGQGLKIVGSGVSLFSDRRLKMNIEKVGELPDGLGVYDYTYIWGQPHRGVMADEVAKLRPWALGEPVAGFATVNYGAL